AGLQHRQPAVVGDDLRARPARQATDRLPGRGRLRAARLHRRRGANPERAEGARAARVGAEGRARRRARADDRVVQGEAAGIRLAWPDLGPEELEALAKVVESGMLTMGARVPEFEAEVARACET